jgi:hypothetical protein
VRLEEWWEASRRYLPQAEEWRKRPAFNRAVSSLVRKRRVMHADGWVWSAKGDLA